MTEYWIVKFIQRDDDGDGVTFCKITSTILGEFAAESWDAAVNYVAEKYPDAELSENTGIAPVRKLGGDQSQDVLEFLNAYPLFPRIKTLNYHKPSDLFEQTNSVYPTGVVWSTND